MRSVSWSLCGLRLCSECFEQITCSRATLPKGTPAFNIYLSVLPQIVRRNPSEKRIAYAFETRFLRQQVEMNQEGIVHHIQELLDKYFLASGATEDKRKRWEDALACTFDDQASYERFEKARRFESHVKKNKMMRARSRIVDESYEPPVLRPRQGKRLCVR